MLNRLFKLNCYSRYFVVRYASYVPRSKNYYAILGIKEDASAEEIKKAFVKKSIELHPDGNKRTTDIRIGWSRETNTEKFMLVKEAYDCLRKPEKRKKYDEGNSKDGFLMEVKSSKFKKESIIDLNKNRMENYMGPGKSHDLGQHFRDPEKEMEAERKKNRFLVSLGCFVISLIVLNIGYVTWLQRNKTRR